MFFLILLSELGDKSQLAILALAAGSAFPVVVFIGALTAFILVDTIGVGFGGRIASKVPTKKVRATAGIVFFAFGLLILFQII
jgi:putative Ca2+/H+ antiporter (TMEM165/GDT1 family)